VTPLSRTTQRRVAWIRARAALSGSA
jgi:hypothetical protein